MSEISFFTKFTFLKSQLSQNSGDLGVPFRSGLRSKPDGSSTHFPQNGPNLHQYLHYVDVFGGDVHCTFRLTGAVEFADLRANTALYGRTCQADQTRAKRDWHGHNASMRRYCLFRVQRSGAGSQRLGGMFENSDKILTFIVTSRR